MIETGRLFRDAGAWQHFLAAHGADSIDVPAPSSFPFIAYPISDDPPRFMVVTADQIEDLAAGRLAKTNYVNHFREGEIDGIEVLADQQVAHLDDRGWLAEVARSDEDGEVPMAYVSLTRPNVTRGPHEHRNQTDRFLFIGQATVWLWDNREGSTTDRVRQRIHVTGVAKVVIPPGIVHAYRNDAPLNNLTVINAPDQLYMGRARQDPVDEVRHEDDPHSKFKPW
jgi:dTDP-4-dehydrorhamnose 3,5-epimerase